jgi:hypothetical protein
MTPKLDTTTFEQLLKTLFKGTYHPRAYVRETLGKFNDSDTLATPLTPEQVEDYVDRVRLHQEEYRLRKENGYIGVGLIFDLPKPPHPALAEFFLAEDRKGG